MSNANIQDILENPGVSHIANQIVSYLNPLDILHCGQILPSIFDVAIESDEEKMKSTMKLLLRRCQTGNERMVTVHISILTFDE